MASYTEGQTVRFSVVFTNKAGTSTDPTVVVVVIQQPDGSQTTYTYGVEAALVKDDTGDYHIDIQASTPGRWHHRWVGTGAIAAISEDKIIVEESKVA